MVSGEGKIKAFPGALLVADDVLDIIYMSDGARRMLKAPPPTLGSFPSLLLPARKDCLEPRNNYDSDPLAFFLGELRQSRDTWCDIELTRRETRFAGEKTLHIWGRRDTTLEKSRFIFYIEDRTGETQLAELLIQAQKGEALGLLCASLAHDLNNVLTILTVQLEQMKDRTAKENLGLAVIDRMLAETGHSAELVQQILSFGRSQPKSAFRHLDLREPISKAAEMISSMLPPDVSLELHLADEELPASADPTMIEQVVINLCLNARDAMPDGGRIVLKGEMTSKPSFPNRRLVEIAVQDTGCGIPPEMLPRIFEPFFSTKNERGTGLGLSSARWIAEFHGGTISAESVPGQGSSFRLLIPTDVN